MALSLVFVPFLIAPFLGFHPCDKVAMLVGNTIKFLFA